MSRFVLFVSFLFVGISVCSAQDSTAVHHEDSILIEVETWNGTIIIGQQLSEDSSAVVINTSSLGNVTIAQKEIKSVKPVDWLSLRNRNYRSQNPAFCSYFLSPSAFQLKSGEGWFRLRLAGTAPDFCFQIGITRYFSIEAGSGITLFQFNYGGNFFYITPKVGFSIAPRLQIGGGITALSTFHGDEKYGLLFTNVTYGSIENNITVGFGTFISEYRSYYGAQPTSEIDYMNPPFVAISGMYRPFRRVAFITENGILPAEFPSNYYSNTYSFRTSAGIRVIGDRLMLSTGVIIRSFSSIQPTLYFDILLRLNKDYNKKKRKFKSV